MKKKDILSCRIIPILILTMYGALNLLSSAVDCSTFIDTIPIFACLLVYYFFYNTRSLTINTPYVLYVMLWLIALLSSSTSHYIGLQSTAITYILFIITLFLIVNLNFSQQELRVFNSFYIAIGVFCAVLILMSYSAGISNGLNRYSIGILKPKNQNYINSIILLAFTISTYRIFIDKNTLKKRIILLLSCMIMVLGVFLTGTRAAILCMCLIVIVQALFYSLKTKKFYLLFSGIFFLLIGYFLLFYVVPKEVSSRFIGEDSFEDVTRLYMWTRSINLFSDNWLIGMGLNATVKYVGNIHNVILQFLVEQGIVAFFIFLIIIFKIIKRSNREGYIFIIPVIIALYFPICFQNGLIAHTFWWPLIVLEVYSNTLKNNKLNVL